MPIFSPHLQNRSPPAMAAAAQEPKVEYAPDELRMPFGWKVEPCPVKRCNGWGAGPFVNRDLLRLLNSRTPCVDFFSLRPCPKGDDCEFAHSKTMREAIWRLMEAWKSPDTENTHNWKGHASPRASVIDDYHGTQDPSGRIFLELELMHSMPLEKVEAFLPLEYRAPRRLLPLLIEECWQPTDFLPDSSLLPKRIEGLSAAAAATFRWERMKIGLPLSLGGISHSPTARVIEAANPGGAEVVLVLDSGASMHAVGEATIMQDIQPFNFDMTITLPDNSSLRIIGIGTVEVNGFHIPNVYLVEGLRKNLISVSQLDREHGTCCCFHGGQCTVMIPGGDVVGGAILEDDGEYFGLYVLRFLEVPQPEE